MTDRPLIDPALLERLGSLELKARYLVEGTLAGLHRSRLVGDNVEFAGHREYSPGDDPRRVDWKAYGRLDRWYLKESVDETNAAVHLAVDCSGSMDYPAEAGLLKDGVVSGGPRKGAGLTKGSFAALLAACVAAVALDQGDAAGLYAFPLRRAVMPPKASRVYLRELAAALERLTPEGKASLQAASADLAGMAGRRGIVCFFSDLLDDDQDALTSLVQLARRGHDVTVFHVLDRSEIDFSVSGLTLFIDAESERQVLAEPELLAKAYREEFGRFLDACRSACVGAGIDYHLAVTDTPPEQVLRGFLVGRQGRRAGG